MKRILIIILISTMVVCGKTRKEDIKVISTSKMNKILKKERVMALETHYNNFTELYKGIERNNSPLIFTVDPAFHIFHLNTLFLMSKLEKEILYPKLKILIDSLLDYENDLLKRFRNTELESPILLNIGFLSVAKELLGIKGEINPEVRKKVEEELALIEKSEGFGTSPVFGYEEDYSQYRVRGYYTRDEVLKRYFKAMMYLSRMGFYINNEKKDIDRAIKETRAAILLCDGLRKKEYDRRPIFNIWGRIFNIISFIAGKSEDLTPYDYINMILEIKGDVYSYIMERENVIDFIEKASLLTRPKIISIKVSDRAESSEVIKCFKLFSQRFTPDSYIFQQLVYTNVGTQQKPRLMPTSLDVMAALGSEMAFNILKNRGEFEYANYEKNLKKLIEEVKGIKKSEWESSIYMLYLRSIRTNIMEKSSMEPFSLDIWHRKELITSSGAWAELKHDMILYAKQSYTLVATAVRTPMKTEEKILLVEPKTETFRDFVKACDRIKEFLTIYEIKDEMIYNRLNSMREFFNLLVELSQKGIIKGEEASRYYNMSGYLKRLTNFGEEIVEDDTRIIADVHTDPNTNNVLQVGSGHPLKLKIFVKDGNESIIFEGGMFSFYEFTHPMSDRLTDEKWRETMDQYRLPIWIRDFVYRIKQK